MTNQFVYTGTNPKILNALEKAGYEVSKETVFVVKGPRLEKMPIAFLPCEVANGCLPNNKKGGRRKW